MFSKQKILVLFQNRKRIRVLLRIFDEFIKWPSRPRGLGFVGRSPVCVCSAVSPSSGVKTEEIRKGRILGGVQGYLEDISGDPSLTKFQGKA